ncbi:CBS domain containing-hemolysin-like protein [Halopolyspora algeriensis]|uniref:CBS domain containing-hemolysin-like protein n=1 Tax=Halopolyspora algeriensis TaxID=1500506 RepID=A0A368VBX0_9ACTN|nr:hemolysin family protein [Halopolyspora algeriensis]RCW38767.1 CBS domain containing-hemolysin-like protein [Halopolyspora algeriensis]TQM55736.1 CBS domain containing-hemolysin-like protein [Halopolyspora algeriensis]
MDLVLAILGLLFVGVLTLGTALAVAAEFSLTSLDRSTIDAHATEVADRRSKTVQRAHSTLSFQLSGAQVAITLTTLVTGYVAEPLIGDLLHPALAGLGLPEAAVSSVSLILAILIATTLSMVFGEMVPKNLAIARPLPTARAVSGYHSAFSRVFRWLIDGMNNSANWVVRRMGIEPQEELRSARSPDELGSIVRSSAEHGTLDESTAELMDRSLRFGDRSADELMTPRVRVESLSSEATVGDLLEAAQRTGFSRFPVHGGDLDNIHGVVHVKQAFGVPLDQRATTPVGSLTRPVPTVPETLDGDALLNRLRGSGLQLALVVDEYGGTAGIVSLEDVVEEIIGDVRDEHDRRETAAVRAVSHNSWLISGLLRSDELTEATGFTMPEGDYETVAGLVLAELGRIPAEADSIDTGGWRLTVTHMDRHRIAELRLTRQRDSAGVVPSPTDDLQEVSR